MKNDCNDDGNCGEISQYAGMDVMQLREGFLRSPIAAIQLLFRYEKFRRSIWIGSSSAGITMRTLNRNYAIVSNDMALNIPCLEIKHKKVTLPQGALCAIINPSSDIYKTSTAILPNVKTDKIAILLGVDAGIEMQTHMANAGFKLKCMYILCMNGLHLKQGRQPQDEAREYAWFIFEENNNLSEAGRKLI